MRALRMTKWRTFPTVTDAPEPDPGPGQVVVRVGGSGACHSDLHLIHDFGTADDEASTGAPTISWDLPMTIGHENAGWVHALGPGVSGVEIGQPVAVMGAWGCGHCRRCLAGYDTLCETPRTTFGAGIGYDGGMAELLLVPHPRHLVPLPDGMDPVVAAPLTDAGLTPYRAISHSLPKLTPSSTAVVIGVGGLGHLAIQILSALTAAKIVAIDPRPEARAHALEYGATAAVAPEEALAAVVDVTRGRKAEAVLDLVGSDETLALAASLTGGGGDLTIVGAAGGTLAVSFFAMLHEINVRTSNWGGRPDLVEVLELGARNLLRPAITEFPLEEAAEAYRQLEEGKVEGRAVIVPNRS